MAYLYSNKSYFELRDFIGNGTIKEGVIFNTYVDANKSRVKSFVLLKCALEEVMLDISNAYKGHRLGTGIGSVYNQLDIDKLSLIKNSYEIDYHYSKNILASALNTKINKLKRAVYYNTKKLSTNEFKLITDFENESCIRGADYCIYIINLAYRNSINVTKAEFDSAKRQNRTC